MKSAVTSLLLVVWQSLCPTVEGQITTPDLPQVPTSSSNLTVVAGSSVPATFVALALLVFSALYVSKLALSPDYSQLSKVSKKLGVAWHVSLLDSKNSSF